MRMNMKVQKVTERKLAFRKIFETNFHRGFSGGGQQAGGIANSLFNISPNTAPSSENNILLLNNLLMNQQNQGYGNNKLGRPKNTKETFSNLNSLENAILGRLMFKNLPGGPPQSQPPLPMNTNPHMFNPGPPPPMPINNNPYNPGSGGFNNTAPLGPPPSGFNMTGPVRGPTGFNQTGPIGNGPQPDNPALQNMFNAGPPPPNQLGMPGPYLPNQYPNSGGYGYQDNF